MGKSWSVVEPGNCNRGGPRIPKRDPYKREQNKRMTKRYSSMMVNDEDDDSDWSKNDAELEELSAAKRT